MKTFFRAGLMAMLWLCLCLHGKAQDTTTANTDTATVKKQVPFGINLQVRSLYVWRGFKVSNAPIADVDMHYYLTKDKTFTVGLWGAGDFTGNYKEFDYYIAYTKPRYAFSIWDVNNFTDFPNSNLFNYNPRSTSHFIDVRAMYNFGDRFPLTVNWATIVLGRDTHVKSDGDVSNSYSNYSELDYRLWKDGGSELHIFVGGGFAFGRQANFYGSKPNIVNTGITINKDLVVFKHHMPVAATAMFNPEKKYGALQLIVNVF